MIHHHCNPCDPCGCCDPCCRNGIPRRVANLVGGDIAVEGISRGVHVTLGLFTVVQITRNVQMLIPVYDFCMPQKECESTTDNPCELFKRIKFPTDEFFPPREIECDTGSGCPACG